MIKDPYIGMPIIIESKPNKPGCGCDFPGDTDDNEGNMPGGSFWLVLNSEICLPLPPKHWHVPPLTRCTDFGELVCDSGLFKHLSSLGSPILVLKINSRKGHQRIGGERNS